MTEKKKTPFLKYKDKRVTHDPSKSNPLAWRKYREQDSGGREKLKKMLRDRMRRKEDRVLGRELMRETNIDRAKKMLKAFKKRKLRLG